MMSNQLGADVSKWQGAIDWAQMGVMLDFAVIKATAGTDYVDPFLAANWSGAHSDGPGLIGVYHWYTPFLDPIVQADWFRQQTPGLPAFWAIDLEDKRSKPAPKEYAARIVQFCERLQEKSGKPAFIYTSPSYWASYIYPGWTYGRIFPLWIANYRSGAPDTPLPWGQDGWDIWQFTDRGRGADYGVSSKQIDLNAARLEWLDSMPR